MVRTITFEMNVPISLTAKVEVRPGGQVHVLDAYMHNDLGGSYIRNLGEKGYLIALDQIATEARDLDRQDAENGPSWEDFDARR